MAAITKDQIETPALLVDMDFLEANIKKMADYFEGKKIRLRPHFKTHKSPFIAHMQINSGAKGITCATLGEAEVLAAAGIRDILLANQIVDVRKINRLAALANNTRITVCADNAVAVEELSRAAQAHGSTVYVLVEIQVGMLRCGVDTKEETLALAKQIANSKGLVFDGFQAYAGNLCHLRDAEERERGVAEAQEKLLDFKAYLESNDIPVKEISGSGTGLYNIPGSRDIWTEAQAGSYVFMDTDYGMLGLGFMNSLTVLTTVIHKRPGFAVADAGLKVCCQEKGAPVIKGGLDVSVIRLCEEHGNLRDDNDQLSYLQRLEYIPSHCCSTANLHDNYYCVRNGMLEMVLPVAARGRSR